MPVIGVGYLLANDLLTDCSYKLIEPVVNTTVPVGGIAVGTQEVNVWDNAMYVGAQIMVGNLGGSLEVVTITVVTPGVQFGATFANAHLAGEPIVGATFPVRQNTDPLFTQPEMIQYLSNAANDFLTDCPIAYQIAENVPVIFSQQNAPLPSDCMVPSRIAVANYPLRETSQSNLDGWDYRWQQAAPQGPYAYFRDKIPQQNFGIWPRQNNTVTCEIVYQQRQAQLMGLADGFLIPDPFLVYVKSRTLSFAYSKDGEMRNPALAKYWDAHYHMGTKISNVWLSALNDPNLELSQ